MLNAIAILLGLGQGKCPSGGKSGSKCPPGNNAARSYEPELHRERGYAPTIHRPQPAGAATAAAPCASAELPPAVRRRFNALCAIMVANGARIDGIELAYNRLATPDGNVSVLGFRATRELQPGETLLFVPYALTLSSPVVRRGGDSHLVRELIDSARCAAGSPAD